MGHEFTGTVSEIGEDIKTVKVGDKVVVPFTVSWYVLSNIRTLLFSFWSFRII
jgi:threonine dehydrogenase-like Zn-dependent dehydrogenase